MGQMMGNLRNAAPGQGGTNVPDPGQGWGNMDSSQRGAAVIGGLGRGLGQGMQNYGQQQQGMQQRPAAGMSPMPQAQPVSPDYFQPQKRAPNSLNFYGEGGM